MQHSTIPDKNIQFLINANYQRMMSYEQAAFLTSEESFKDFYNARADESEANIHQLYLLMNGQESTDSRQLQGSDATFAHLLHGKKTAVKILASIKTIEATILKWYKNTLAEIRDLPKHLLAIIEAQYRLLTNTRMQLEHL
ncbi:MAG: hypothetical protein ABIQ88_01645 [Chitinophagaceae bacterium]